MSLLIAQYTLLSWEGTQKVKYCTQFGSCLGQKWHPVDHNGLICAAKNTFNHHNISWKGYKTLMQQCISLLVVLHPLPHDKRVPEITGFCAIWETTLMRMTRYGPQVLDRQIPAHLRTQRCARRTPASWTNVEKREVRYLPPSVHRQQHVTTDAASQIQHAWTSSLSCSRPI